MCWCLQSGVFLELVVVQGRDFDYCSFTLTISINSKKSCFYVVLSRFSRLALAPVLKISSHQVVMFFIECQFTGTLRPHQTISAYLGM